MRWLYLLPFAYFIDTRLRKGGHWPFQIFYEWIPTLLVAAAFGSEHVGSNLIRWGLSYAAFISIYEIGYLVNDLVVARFERSGNLRGPQESGWWWLATWIAARCVIFGLLTFLLGVTTSAAWWTFYAAVATALIVHNVLRSAELRSITFIALAWLRFMAPVMFVLPDRLVPGIALAALFPYAAFRLFAYLDSKELLRMPRRKTATFRLAAFLGPLVVALALLTKPDARGFVVVAIYYAVVSVVGVSVQKLLSRRPAGAR